MRRRPLLQLLALGALLVGVAGGPASAYTIEKGFYTLSEECVSPHLAWAKPYAGGKVKALFIVPRGAAREVIEVAERLDLDYQVVMTLSENELGWTAKSGPYAPAEGISLEEMTRETNEKLQGSYDVIVTGLLSWDMFPRETLYRIMQKVHDGTGLVHGYQQFGRNKLVDRLFAKAKVEDPFVTEGVPWQALPVWRELGIDKVIELREFHAGRMVLLDEGAKPYFLCLTPKPKEDDLSFRELHYEYYQSLLIKAILWAAKKEPAVRFAAIGVGADTIDRTALAATKLAARLKGPTEGLKAHVTVRDEDGRVFVDATTPCGGGTVGAALPVMPAGRYFADVLLRSEAGSVNWASTAFTVTSDPGVASVALDKLSAQPGETVTASAKLTGKVPPDASLLLAVTDNLGRLVLRKTMKPAVGQDTVPVPFRLAHPLALSAEVRVYLLVGAADRKTPQTASVGSAAATLYLPLRHSRANFTHSVWSADYARNELPRRLMIRQLHDAEVDMQTNSSVNPATQAWSSFCNFDTVPYATRYSYEGTDKVRQPCLTDPKFLQDHLAALQKVGADLAPYGPRAYTLGDECFLADRNVDVCFSPTCIADLRQWLRGEYASVADLNASWGTSYQSFDEAEPITLEEARKANQPARWVDHRRHMEFVYARMMERAREAIRRGDPKAEVGFDGPFDTNSWSGNDWWRLMNAFTMCNVYFHQPTQWEFLRSFAKPGILLGLWYGGYFEHRTEDQERLWPWRGLLHGFNSMWWYNVYHGLSICPMDAITPSMTLYPSFRWATEEVKEIRRGEGMALMNAHRLHDGLAVHYSQSSVHAATWSPDFGAQDAEWLATFATLEDMGRQYAVRAYQQIEEQGIDPKEYRVLILPCSQAISPKEAAAMRRYVADGGVLIADVRPGVCDQHGKPVSPGLLDDLFGVRRVPGKGVLKGVAGALDQQPPPNAPPNLKLSGLDVDGDVQVTDGVAAGSAGGAPIVIRKRTGQGCAFLLNYSFAAPYRQRLDPYDGRAMLPLWYLLDYGGARSLFTVTYGADRNRVRELEIVRYQDGPIHYYGFLKYRTDPQEAAFQGTVSAESTLPTYDVRAARYLGNVRQWSTEFVPARAKLFAQLPYTIDGVKVAVSRAAAGEAAQEMGPLLTCNVSVVTASKQPGRHWVNVRLIGPNGRECAHYLRNVSAPAGKGSVVIPLALNDAAGTWKVIAREVISGKTGQATFALP